MSVTQNRALIDDLSNTQQQFQDATKTPSELSDAQNQDLVETFGNAVHISKTFIKIGYWVYGEISNELIFGKSKVNGAISNITDIDVYIRAGKEI